MSAVDGFVDSIRRNIKLNYVYTALYNTGFDKGVWMLFLGYRGLGLVEIGLVESTYQFAMLVFGIPAGAISDLLGRKVSLVLSVVTKIIGYSLILLSHDMIGFAAAFGLNAISTVLYQGASESLTYDSCKIAGLQGNYKKIYGNILAVTFIATALGIAAGGLIAGTSFEWVYYASIVMLLAALVPAAMFTETRDIAKGARQSVAGLFSRSAKLITGNPLILYLLLLSACITVVDMTIYMYCQKYFEAMAIPIYFIGLAFCVDSVAAALGARYAYLFERFHNRDVILLIPGIIVAMYILLSLINAPVVVLLLWTATIFVVGFWPILSELINARVPTENRATVLSMKNQLSSLGVMIVFPAVGLIAASSSLSVAFLWLLVAAMPLMAYCVVKIRRIAF
jgi:MFS family permease